MPSKVGASVFFCWFVLCSPFFDSVTSISVEYSTCVINSDCGVPPSYFCWNGICEQCQTDLDCTNGKKWSIMRCGSEGKCVEKNLFDDFTNLDALVSIGSILITSLATGGGIGGGGLLVPLFAYAIGLHIKHAIPLSKVTIFGSSMATLMLNFHRKHPLMSSRCLIDWEVIALLEPLTLVGTTFGVIMNKVFPSWLVLLLLIALLLFTGIKTWKKANQLYAIESNVEMTKPKNSADSIKKFPIYDMQVLEFMTVEESKAYHPIEVTAVGISWIITFICSYMKQYETTNILGITCGDSVYWLLTFFPIPFQVIITFLVGKHILWRYNQKVALNYRFVDGDIKWDMSRIVIYPTICILAGIASGLLGVGGGLVKGPIMLSMGMIPEVQTVTAGIMILFTSSSTSLQYLLNGQFPGEWKYDYILWYSMMGFLGSFIGQCIVKRIVRKTGKASFLVFLLAFLILLSGLSLCITTSKKVIHDLESGQSTGMEGLCSS